MTRDEWILLGGSAAASAVVGAVLWKQKIVHPEGFPPKRNRDVLGVPAAVWLVCALLTFLAQMEGALLASQGPEPVMGPAKGLQRDALTNVAGYLAGLIVGVLLLWMLRPRVSEKAGIGFKPETLLGDIARGVVAILLLAPFYLVVSLAAQGVAGLVQGAAPDQIAHTGLKQILDNRSSPWGNVLMGTAVVGAPVVEELVYRGMLQSCLLRVLERTWPAIIGTSALFAAMHVIGGGPVPLHATIPLFVLSIGMGVAYERTRSLVVPITMHMLFNAGNVVLGMMQTR